MDSRLRRKVRAAPPCVQPGCSSQALFSSVHNSDVSNRQPACPPIHSSALCGSLSHAALRRWCGSEHNLLLWQREWWQARGRQRKYSCPPCGRSSGAGLQLLVAAAYRRHQRATVCVGLFGRSAHVRTYGRRQRILLGAVGWDGAEARRCRACMMGIQQLCLCCPAAACWRAGHPPVPACCFAPL